MTTLQFMILLSLIMFCAQVLFCIKFEQMKWYWAVYSALVMYTAVVLLLAVLANLETLFPLLH